MNQYQQTYKEKFQQQLNTVNWLKLDQDKTIIQLQTQINKFQLFYKNFEQNCYLNNLSQYQLTFYKTQKIIRYKYSQNNPSVIRDIAKIRIHEITDQFQDMVADVKFFLIIILFDFQIGKKSELENFINIIGNNLQYFDLLILNLNLVIQYEQEKLILSQKSFQILKTACKNFVKSCQYSYETNYNLNMILNFFEMSSQIFQRGNKSFHNSLLSQMNFEIIQNNPNFWLIFYNNMLKKNVQSETNYKQKQLLCIENKDLLYSKNYMLEVFIKFQLNPRYIDLDKIMCNTKYNNEDQLGIENEYKNDKKIENFLKLFIKKSFQYFDFDIYIKLIQLKRSWYIGNRRLILIQKLLYQDLDQQLKQFFWIFLTKSKLDIQKQRKLSQKSERQIHMDVIRTKSLSDQQESVGRIQGLLQCFFENNKEKLDYFQGFNYIANFLHSLYNDNDDTLQILRYISKNILNEFFKQDLALKIDELNFVAQKILKKYFQEIYIHWQNEQVEMNHLFQGYFVSLFTNLDQMYNDIVFNFWNFILFVFQKEKLGRILYMFLLLY